MGHTVNSVIINASYDKVFDMSNDIGRWQEFFEEYTASEVLEKEGNKITFKLTHKNGSSWVSYRILLKEHYFAYAQRQEPMFPFEYMKIIWLYRPLDGGIEMRWIQDFQMSKDAKYSDEEVEKLINEHSQKNLKRFKEIIESSK